MSRLWISEFAAGTAPLNAPGSAKVFAMLWAYMDDSGSHDRSHNCVVAGYWGGVNRWKKFERAWKAILLRERVEEFKANEFWPTIKGKHVGPYEDWSEDRRAYFIRDLLVTIVESGIVPFGCGVLGAEWNAQPLNLREIITLADSPKKAKSLLIPFQRNVYRAASYCKPGVRMNFVFDHSATAHVVSGLERCYAGIKGQAIELKDPIKDNLGAFSTDDSKIAVPLQAADLLAYEMHRFAKQKERGVSNMRDAYKIALLRLKTMEDFWLFDGPRFERIGKIFSKGADREIESELDRVRQSNGHDFEGRSEGSERGNGSREAGQREEAEG